MPTSTLDDFRGRYSLRAPKFISSSQEMKLLEAGDGLRLLQTAPATGISRGRPPSSLDDPGVSRYLWVIGPRGIPYIIESPVFTLGSELPKHTNLTGGSEAYLGGELWFASSATLYVSGGSGRYPPLDESQLEEAAQVFHAYGYEVTSLGWNQSTGYARRVLEVP